MGAKRFEPSAPRVSARKKLFVLACDYFIVPISDALFLYKGLGVLSARMEIE